MQKWSNIKWMPVLMTGTILAIAAFQVYWLSQAYEREERTLDMRTNFMFRDAVFQLQGNKLKLDKISPEGGRAFVSRSLENNAPESVKVHGGKVVSMANILLRKVRDSANRTIIIRGNDTLQMFGEKARRRGRLMQFLFDVDSVQDSVRVAEVQTAFAKKLKEQKLSIPFSVERIQTNEKDDPSLHQVTLGFTNPITYKLNLYNKTSVLLKRILVPILFSVFLIGFTFLSFMLLYRNLLKQKRLAEIKNEFISNITHELKTPIATVSVAIEAMRSFNTNMSPERSKEYLDISANELQRLSMLVDKVLKLSMFEKKEVELKYEPLDMKGVVDEVTASMRLQFENKRALVKVSGEGDTSLEGDRLHLVSVVYNLIDNALKYSNGHPEIDVHIKGGADQVLLTVKDKGIGISQEYHDKIFDKFFRVPTGNLHNAKGYGLGLSYVAHVVQKHDGTIQLQSANGKGTSFVIAIPKHAQAS